MIDKILHLFGLMTIHKAKFINAETIKLYARAMSMNANNDFGVAANPNQDTDAARWADECFDQIMREYEPGAVLVGAWELE